MTLNLTDMLAQGGWVAIVAVLIFIVFSERKSHSQERREWADMVLGAREQFRELAEDSIVTMKENQNVLMNLTDAINRMTEGLALDRRLSRIEAGLGKTPGEGNGKEDKL